MEEIEQKLQLKLEESHKRRNGENLYRAEAEAIVKKHRNNKRKLADEETKTEAALSCERHVWVQDGLDVSLPAGYVKERLPDMADLFVIESLAGIPALSNPTRASGLQEHIFMSQFKGLRIATPDFFVGGAVVPKAEAIKYRVMYKVRHGLFITESFKSRHPQWWLHIKDHAKGTSAKIIDAKLEVLDDTATAAWEADTELSEKLWEINTLRDLYRFCHTNAPVDRLNSTVKVA